MSRMLSDYLDRADVDVRNLKNKEVGIEHIWSEWLDEVNEQGECLALLDNLNRAISMFWQLSDPYYTDYIFNAGRAHQEQLNKMGFDEHYFADMASRLEQLRAILYGQNINYDKLLSELKEDLLGHEMYWSKLYGKRCKDLEYENERLKKQIENDGDK